MDKFLTDMHTHSTLSHDGRDTLEAMLCEAQKKGVSFYGVSEHFDFDYDLSVTPAKGYTPPTNAQIEETFHKARHLQEDYEGVMNVAIGAEFAYADDEKAHSAYRELYDRYHPDFVINSVHSANGLDFCWTEFTGTKEEIFRNYLRMIRRSLDAPYPYDIVGHIGYVARYVPFEDKTLSLEEFGEEIDDILKTIIAKGKILEVNSSTKIPNQISLPDLPIVQRYYDLGGRKVSFGSDAHFKERILDKREELVSALKKIGFTYITVPFKGEYIKVEI